MANQKQSDVAFLIYKDWWNFFKELSDKQSAKLINAIFDFQINGKDFVTDDVQLKTIWLVFKMAFSRDNIKYENKCKKNSEKANKRWQNAKQKYENESSNQKPSYDIDEFEAEIIKNTPKIN